VCDSDGVVLTPEQQELVDILTPEFVQTALDATYAKLAERWEKLVNATSELNEEMRFGKIGLQDLTYSLIRSDERKDFHKELSEARERMLSLRDLTIRLGKGWSSFNLLANTQ